jgi:mono/diheme cytochrome c family protein
MSAPSSRGPAPTGRRPLPWKVTAALAGALGVAAASQLAAGPFAAAAPPPARNAGGHDHDRDHDRDHGRDQAHRHGHDRDDHDRGHDPRGDAERIAAGRDVFRYDTFGDEQQWTDRLRMHEVIESAVDPLTALALGLKVDVDALPDEVLAAIELGAVDLTDPATTLALIELDAVVGVVGTVRNVDGQDRLTRVGVTCALCHSTVDDAFAPGIGHRLDGWPNTDLDPGAIIAASPAVPANAKAVYNSWGPGKYDPRFNLDGKTTPLVIPPAFGLANVKSETYTAEGPVSYWNRYVAVTQMGGQGSFTDERLGIHVVQNPDLVKNQLGILGDYQFSLATPAAPAGSFDPVAAARGKAVFRGAGQCATCHIGPLYTDVNRGVLHAPAETGMDPAYALRTATQRYRTTPLRALATHPPYFHDGSAATLEDVVSHYDSVRHLGLTPAQKHDLVEFLRSI